MLQQYSTLIAANQKRMVLSKGTHYADTSRAVADATAILAAARQQYERSQHSLTHQCSMRIKENRLEEKSIRDFIVAEHSVLSPTKSTVSNLLSSLELDVAATCANAEQLHQSVQQAERLRHRKERLVRVLEEQVHSDRSRKAMSLAYIAALTKEAQEAVTRNECESAAVDREVATLEEQNSFLRIQHALKEESQRLACRPPSPVAVFSNGYSLVPDTSAA